AVPPMWPGVQKVYLPSRTYLNSALVSGGRIVLIYSSVVCLILLAISSAAPSAYSKKLICKRRSFRLTSRVEYVLANAYNGRFSFILLISSHSSRLYLSQSKITPHRRALFSISFNKSSRSFG